jgi:hypothetical protein
MRDVNADSNFSLPDFDTEARNLYSKLDEAPASVVDGSHFE